jgi:lipopolysaccharide export system ATP-binding protein
VRETLSICDRAYIIKDGTILREGKPGEIAADPTVRQIYLGHNFQLG